MISALGFPYMIVLPLFGLISFVLAMILVMRGKGPMATAGLILVVHVPFLIGIFAAIQGAIASYSVIAVSPAAPKPSEVAAAVSTALIAPLAGMLLMVPGYAIATIGAVARSLSANAAQSSNES